MDTHKRIAVVESQLRTLQAEQTELAGQLVQARVDLWRSRVENIQLQVHLAKMTDRERLSVLAEELGNTWERTKDQLGDTVVLASTVTGTVWSGLESAYHDVRTALVESAKQLQD